MYAEYLKGREAVANEVLLHCAEVHGMEDTILKSVGELPQVDDDSFSEMSTDDFERLVFEEGKHRRAASDDELFNDCAEDEPPSEEALGAGGSAAPITGGTDDTGRA